MRILVADDAEDIRVTMQVLLQLRGHTVSTAADGKQAVDVAVRERPDVVLMDLQMPVMDGFAATRALRAMPEMHRLPIVAISAYVQDKTWCDLALAAGCSACVAKPIDTELLERVLTTLTERRRAS
jgi:CheY-like chemotaxis protein